MQFLRNTGFLVASNASVFFVTFLIQVIYARYYGQEAFGGYSFLLAWFTPIFLLFGMNLQQLIPSLSDEKFVPSIIQQSQAISLGAATLLAVVVLVVLACDPAYAGLVWVGALVLATKVLETYSIGLHGFWYRDGRYRESSYLRLWRSIAIGTLLVVVTHLLGNPYLTLASPLICYLGFLRIETRAVQVRETVGGVLTPFEFLQLGYYSGLASFFDSLIALTPRIYLGAEGKMSEIASFTAVISLALLPALLVNPLANVAIGNYRRRTSRKSRFVLLVALYAICLIIGLFAYLNALWFGEFFLAHVYGVTFANAGIHLPAACITATFWYLSSMNGSYLQARMRYRQQFMATLSGFFVTLLVPWLGLDIGSSVDSAIGMYTMGMFTRCMVSGAFVVYDLVSEVDCAVSGDFTTSVQG